MKLLLIVPDGVAIRNYIYTNLIAELQRKNVEVSVYHRISKSGINEINKIYNGTIAFKEIPEYKESFIATFIRESLVYARLLRYKSSLENDSIMSFWNKNQKTLKRKILYAVAAFLGSVFSKSYRVILKLDSLYNWIINRNETIKLIEKDFDYFKPTLILNLHQRSVISAPIAFVAKKRGVKSATVIFSWDNVPKARLISRYDSYLVWSDLMKNQLCNLYQEIKREQVVVVGTPQFEFYFDKSLYQPKVDFFSMYNLDNTKKTICFSSNDESSPYEQNYLEDLCSEIEKINEKERPQILFRRSPVDQSHRFDLILKKYKSIIFSINPDWKFDDENEKSFSTIFPAINDSSLLVNTVKYSDVVVNLGSTMAHDFAVLDKPCLYFNYDPVQNSKFEVETVYKFEHFKSMKDLDAVGWINKKSEISIKIIEAINNPDKVGKDRKEWLKKIVNHPLENSSNLIVKALIN